MNSLAEKVISGDSRALARAITLVENRSGDYLELLKDLYREGGKARVVGITGPPGAGKSTLANVLIHSYRERGFRVAVVAVDPSSAFSGGAILGDRVRMQDRALDDGVFIRSMATRGHMGGLATATSDVVNVLDAADFDLIMVETVGVGQDEVDIVREADTVLVLLVPGLGDDIQAIKAGVMEIADVFVINKADRSGADRVERELHSAMTLAGVDDAEWTPPIVKTVATKGTGVEELVGAVENHAAFLSKNDAAVKRQRLKYGRKFRDLLAERFLMGVRKHWLSEEEEEKLVETFLRREGDPYSCVDKILKAVEWEKKP